jgi:mutator protein MutT
LPNASAPSSTATNKTAIDVVAAIIERDGPILITRRLQGTHLEGLWEFPGGKVHAGESHVAALQREIREELDAEITVGELVLSTTHHYEDRSVTLHFYRCSLHGEPRAVLGQEMRWTEPRHLRTLSFPPADAQLIDRLSGEPLGSGAA